LRQRTRWGHGAMQVLRKEHLFTTRGLTLPQRLCYLATVLTYFDGWQKAVFYLSPVVVLSTGVMPVSALGLDFFLHFIPFYFLTFLVFEEVARGYVRTMLLAQYNMARFATFAWSTLALFRRKLKFQVTQKALRGQRFKFYTLPQYLVLLLNGIAIPLGIILYGLNGKLPEEGLIANIVWAAINTLLALALLSFSLRRSANRRAEYRFPVPLPAKIKASRQHAIYGTVDDISPSGVRIHARIPGSVETGTPVNGEIYLPHRVLPFSATVCSLVPSPRSAERYVKAVGCRFDERDGKWRAEIEHFLYGSDLQWRIQHLEERATTLMDRLTLTTGTNERRVARWAPVIFESPQGDSASRIGLVSSLESGQAPRILLTFTPLALTSRIIAFAFSRAGQSLLQGEIISEERLESPVAPIFLYHLVATVREQEWIKNNISQIIPLAARQFA
jgi:PilZ domain